MGHRSHLNRQTHQKVLQNWNALKNGDKVEVIAPSSVVSNSDFKMALKFLKQWGLVPKVKKNLLEGDLLCSQSPFFRFKHFKEALEARDSKVIFCLRGGYGSNHLLPQLSLMKKPKVCKLIVGFSDITFLHSFLNYQWKWPSLYASNLVYLIEKKNKKSLVSKSDIASLKDVLFGLKKTIEIKNLEPLNQEAKAVKEIRSSLTGGNLRILTSLIGTPWIRSLKSKILVLEDVNEKAYFLDRMFFQFKESGIFENIKAIIFGNFTFSKQEDHQKGKIKEAFLLEKVIQRFSKDSKIPIFKTSVFGHGKRQFPLPLMTKAILFSSNQKQKVSFSLKISTAISSIDDV